IWRRWRMRVRGLSSYLHPYHSYRRRLPSCECPVRHSATATMKYSAPYSTCPNPRVLTSSTAASFDVCNETGLGKHDVQESPNDARRISAGTELLELSRVVAASCLGAGFYDTGI